MKTESESAASGKHLRGVNLITVSVVIVLAFQAVAEMFSSKARDVKTMVLKSEGNIQIAVSLSNSDETYTLSVENVAVDDSRMSTVAAQPFELMEWERKSMPTANTSALACDRPAGISQECCLGSFSTGGGLRSDMRSRCQAMEHEQLTKNVNELLELDSCDLCRVLEHAAEYNQTIALWGDSVQNQIWSGLVCEIQRRGFDIVSRNRTKMDWDEDVCTGMFCLIHIDEVVVQVGKRTARLRMYFQYFLVDRDNSVENVTRDIVANNDILLFNFGLHVRHSAADRISFTKRMSWLFEEAAEHGNLTLLIYRETSAQNFDAPSNGDYWTQDDMEGNRQCVDMRYGHNAGWRNGIIENAAKNQSYGVFRVTPFDVKQTYRPPRPSIPSSGLRNSGDGTMASTGETPSLHIFPFWDFTANMWHMHPHHEGKGECTHFCSTPILWMPLWRYLRVSMEDKFFGDGVHDFIARR